MRFRSVIAVTFAVLAMSAVGRGAVFDFETAGQYSGNFRKIAGPGTPVQTGPSDENDYVRLSGTTNFTAVYDTTPADGTEKTTYAVSPGSPLIFSADLRFATSTSSFGVYIVDAANEGAGYLALLNVNQSGSNELIRFAGNATPNTGGAGTLVTGASGDVMGLNEFVNASFTYSITEDNHPKLQVTAGALSDFIIFDTISAPLTTVQVAIRDSSQLVGANDFDNVSIVGVVPEPAGLGMVTLALLILGRQRSRRELRNALVIS